MGDVFWLVVSSFNPSEKILVRQIGSLIPLVSGENLKQKICETTTKFLFPT